MNIGMKIRVRTTLADDEGHDFMGIGLVCLLEGIDRERSVHRAAEGMGLSYVKALKILKRLEQELGCTVVERRRGGNDRGGAELNPAGRRLLESFQTMQQRINKVGELAFNDFQNQWRKRS
jgi:molybdate transport repressor ModE-like protein